MAMKSKLCFTKIMMKNIKPLISKVSDYICIDQLDAIDYSTFKCGISWELTECKNIITKLSWRWKIFLSFSVLNNLRLSHNVHEKSYCNPWGTEKLVCNTNKNVQGYSAILPMFFPICNFERSWSSINHMSHHSETQRLS